ADTARVHTSPCAKPSTAPPLASNTKTGCSRSPRPEPNATGPSPRRPPDRRPKLSSLVSWIATTSKPATRSVRLAASAAKIASTVTFSLPRNRPNPTSSPRRYDRRRSTLVRASTRRPSSRAPFLPAARPRTGRHPNLPPLPPSRPPCQAWTAAEGITVDSSRANKFAPRLVQMCAYQSAKRGREGPSAQRGEGEGEGSTGLFRRRGADGVGEGGG